MAGESTVEILSVGATVKYASPTTGGACPTSGFTELTGVASAPSVEFSLDTLEVSTIKDKIKKYLPGQQDPGGDKQFQLIHSEANLAAWNAMVTTAGTSGVWFEYAYPGATKSFFWKGMPQSLGNSGIEKNTASMLTGNVSFLDGGTWGTASTT